jgi:hypothetical protein
VYLVLADDTCEALKQKLWLSHVGDRWLASASEYITKMFVNVGEAGYSDIAVLSWIRFPHSAATEDSAKLFAKRRSKEDEDFTLTVVSHFCVSAHFHIIASVTFSYTYWFALSFIFS